MTVNDVLRCLEQAAPYELAEHWDNCGLLVGRRTASVRGVLCALDITPEVVAEASERGCNLIVAHHPVIFGKLSRVTGDDPTGALVMQLIENGIAAICMHTNMDCSPIGVNDLLAAQLGLLEVKNLGGGESAQLGRIGFLHHPMELNAFVQHVKLSLGAGGIRAVAGGSGAIRCVAVGGGACGDLMELAKQQGADALVIGDSNYHTMMHAREVGIHLLDAGHFPTENAVVQGFRDLIAEQFPDCTAVISGVHRDCIRFY